MLGNVFDATHTNRNELLPESLQEMEAPPGRGRTDIDNQADTGDRHATNQ